MHRLPHQHFFSICWWLIRIWVSIFQHQRRHFWLFHSVITIFSAPETAFLTISFSPDCFFSTRGDIFDYFILPWHIFSALEETFLTISFSPDCFFQHQGRHFWLFHSVITIFSAPGTAFLTISFSPDYFSALGAAFLTISNLHFKIKFSNSEDIFDYFIGTKQFFSTGNGIFDYFSFFSALETAFLTIYKYLKYKN